MPGTSVFQKLKVITWKNCIIRERHWMATAFEIVIPLLVFAIVIYFQSQPGMAIANVNHNEPTYNPQRSSKNIFETIDPNLQLYYTPQTKFTKSLISKVQAKLQLNSASIKIFSTEYELIAYYQKNTAAVTMGIVFHIIDQGEKIPLHFNYSIRPYNSNISNWETGTLFKTEELYKANTGSENYFMGGFIAIQLALDTSFIEMNLPLIVIPKADKFVLQEFPYPPYVDSSARIMLIACLVYATMFTFLVISPDIVRRIGEEKSTGIKELMKMMGLKSWMLWLGWFQHQLPITIVFVFIITILLTFSWGAGTSIIHYCNKSLFVVFLILYYASGITFCFTISSFFNRPSLAVVVTILLLLMTVLFTGVGDPFPNIEWWDKIWFALFPNLGLNFGYAAISAYSAKGMQLHWTNFFQSPSGDKNDVTLGNVFVMFLIAMVVYMVITLYFENVRPGPYGLPKPFYFPITCIYYRIRKKSNKIDCCNDLKSEHYCKIEPVTNLKAGIQIRNLYKKFGTEFVVKGLSIDIYEGQITALLGHNGAGKTTTMSIITGMIAATSGSVVINGANIKHEMNKIHGIMGLCPQHNLQFTDLTVAEHLIFFGMLKGLTLRQARNESRILLQRLNLRGQQNSLAPTLSGGMRRRLSLGIALIGKSKVLILDEPTSGLDPESRREIWDLLLSFRGSRTILISTHFMEEAEVLGDRIAIMDHGRLICYGTSMFLKKEYGSGYNLTIVLKSNSKENSNQKDDVTKIVKNTIEGAVLQSVIGNQLTYLLPFDKRPQFGILLLELENKKQALAISSIALSITTLEEVFLKIGHLTSEEDNSVTEEHPVTLQVNPNNKLVGTALYIQQVKALLRKRLLTTRIKLSTFLVEAFLTLVLTLMLLIVTSVKLSDIPVFNMALSKYGETLVYYGPESTNRDINKVRKCYIQQVQAQRGLAISSGSVSNAIIDKGIENIAYYEKHMIVSVEFNTSSGSLLNINAMYSNAALHGAPISLNLVTNAIVKAFIGNSHEISTSNNPLPVTSGVNSKEFKLKLTAGSWFLLFPLGLLFFTSSFVVFPQMEIANKAKQLQLMCGVKSCCYWLTFYIFDLILYWIMVIAIIGLVLWNGSVHFSGDDEIRALSLILLVYGFCVIPYSYLYAYNDSSIGAFTRYLMVSLFSSIFLSLIIFITEYFDSEYYNLVYLFLWLPQFGLAYTIGKFSYYVMKNYNFLHSSAADRILSCVTDPNPCCDSLTSDGCREHLSYFEGDSENISVFLLIMMASSFLYFTILLLLECTYILKMIESSKLMHVEIENQPEVDEYPDEDNVLIAKKLTKIYKGKQVVKGISFCIKRGDCFGLLGVNGAGKTTTFRMLTGDEVPTDGDVEIKDISSNSFKLSENVTKYLRNIGYCPQFDGIIEVLTGRQMLKLFAELRGEPNATKAHAIDEWISILGLQEYADKPCGKYSGGNKRKLSVAMAFITFPLVVMLDEPTSGVDPISRRKLWNVITMLRTQDVKTSIVLCSHSMDECETLCDKLTIMKAGRLECSGTISQLKEQYAQGFTVKIKLKGQSEGAVNETRSSETENELSNVPITTDILNLRRNTQSNDSKEVQQLMADFELKYFGACELYDKHSGLLHYRITDNKQKLNQLFDEMEKLSHKHSIIEDYQISDTTLEEVFLSIARS